MIKIELLVLIIGIIVFLIQNKVKEPLSKISIKLVYWTVLFFISLFFNSILFSSYNEWYSLNTYLNFNTALIVVGVALTYVLIQTMAPFEYMKDLKKKFSKNQLDVYRNERKTEKVDEEIKEQNNYSKQLHFEIFLETICWVGFIAAFALEGFMLLMGDTTMNSLIEGTLTMVVCLTLMATVPITLRQIIFYLFRIRSIKGEYLTEDQLKLKKKLRKENVRL